MYDFINLIDTTTLDTFAFAGNAFMCALLTAVAFAYQIAKLKSFRYYEDETAAQEAELGFVDLTDPDIEYDPCDEEVLEKYLLIPAGPNLDLVRVGPTPAKKKALPAFSWKKPAAVLA